MSTVEQKARDVIQSVLQNQSLFGRSAAEAQMACRTYSQSLPIGWLQPSAKPDSSNLRSVKGSYPLLPPTPRSTHDYLLDLVGKLPQCKFALLALEGGTPCS
jgi:hypothetical protein